MVPPCCHTGGPRCRYGLSLGRPHLRHGTGNFPGLPLDPVNGSFYRRARKTFTYRETLDMRGFVVPLRGPYGRPPLSLRTLPGETRQRHLPGDFTGPLADPVNGSCYACIRFVYV